MQTKGDGTDNTQSTDVLAKVKLESFTAAPSTIVPFQSSTLAWTVSGPKEGGFTVDLDGVAVAATGKLAVSPPASRAYGLTAHAGTITTDLGGTYVTVDTSACQMVPTRLPNSTQLILQQLMEGILKGDKSLYQTPPDLDGPGPARLNVPTLSYQPGVMIFDFYVSKRIDDEPDPRIHAHIETGLAINPADGSIQFANPSLKTDVSNAGWLYLVPILNDYVLLKTALSEPAIHQKFEPLFDGILSLLGVVYGAGTGFRYLSVSIPGGDADPPVQFVACPSGAG
jgi:hypothetical protein